MAKTPRRPPNISLIRQSTRYTSHQLALSYAVIVQELANAGRSYEHLTPAPLRGLDSVTPCGRLHWITLLWVEHSASWLTRGLDGKCDLGRFCPVSCRGATLRTLAHPSTRNRSCSSLRVFDGQNPYSVCLCVWVSWIDGEFYWIARPDASSLPPPSAPCLPTKQPCLRYRYDIVHDEPCLFQC